MKRINFLALLLGLTFGLSGCVVYDDEPVYVHHSYGSYESAIDYYHRPPRPYISQHHKYQTVHSKPKHIDDHHPHGKKAEPIKKHADDHHHAKKPEPIKKHEPVQKHDIKHDMNKQHHDIKHDSKPDLGKSHGPKHEQQHNIKDSLQHGKHSEPLKKENIFKNKTMSSEAKPDVKRIKVNTSKPHIHR